MISKTNLIKFHRKLCRDLGIEPSPYICFISDSFKSDGTKLDAFGEYHLNSKHIYINFNYTHGQLYNLKALMAHETYHHYQNSMGFFKNGLYKGIDESKMNHRQKPSERAAMRYQEKIRNELILERKKKKAKEIA